MGMFKDRGFLLVAGVIALIIAADIFANHGNGALFMVRKVLQLVEYLEFWR